MATVYKRGGKSNRSGWYYISYTDHDGKRKTRSSRTTDKATAERIANKLESDAALRRDGVIDASDDRYAAEARRPLTAHLAEFKTALAGKGNTPQHCHEAHTQTQKIIGKCGAEFICDLTASVVQEAIKSLCDEGKSLKTCNHYLRATKSFSRWLHRDKRTRDDALAILEAYNAATDPRRVRRELSIDELSRLIATTEQRTLPEHKIPGPDRAMVYRLALGTGFRAKELRSMTPASFDLDADPPTVTVTAAHSKRRRTDAQPIRRDLAERLRPWLAGRPRDERLFARLPKNTARMLRSDLKAARATWIEGAGSDREKAERKKSDFLAYANAAGELFDFHATRHSYISGIVNGGASVKVAQELARHSTPTLTIGRYAHTRLHDLQGALDSLPNFSKPSSDAAQPEAVALPATGTDGPQTTVVVNTPKTYDDNRAQRSAQQTERETVRFPAKGCEGSGEDAETSGRRKSMKQKRLSDTVRVRAKPSDEYPHGESNPGFRAENPTSWATRRWGRMCGATEAGRLRLRTTRYGHGLI
jgi:integrase